MRLDEAQGIIKYGRWCNLVKVKVLWKQKLVGDSQSLLVLGS